MSKRANPFAEFAAPSSAMAKRLKRVERKVNQVKPEMKHITYNLTGTVTAGTLLVSGLTAMTQGDAINNRSGDRIKVWRIEIRGVSASILDQYLIQSHGPDAPVLADFNTSVGAFISDSTSNTRLTEWKHFRNLYNAATTNCPLKIVQRFKNGIGVKYEGTSSPPVDNGLYFCALNRGPSDVSINTTARVWYTDA